MKAENLRVGNHVSPFFKTQDGKKHYTSTVRCLHMNTCEVKNSETFQYNMIGGVSLSEDWLIKLGFIKYNNVFFKIKVKRSYVDGWYLTQNNELTKSLNEFMIRINYVHELQNLFFALTGAELELNTESSAER